jgi:amidophosphoribosyltransferase
VRLIRRWTTFLDGADAIMGLANHSPKLGPINDYLPANDEVGLHNSRFDA